MPGFISKLHLRSSARKLTSRTLTLRLATNGGPATLDETARTVEVVAATEAPVAVLDWDRMEVVDEVLLMSGCQLPGARRMPLLDTHSRYDTSSVVGSLLEPAVSGDELLGRCQFSKDPSVDPVWTKVREGHLTDFSIGYTIDRKEYIPDGESAHIAGREFNGPLRVVTRWTPKELSVCPIGADDRAKARAAEPTDLQTIRQENNTMNKRLRASLEARGLAADATEDEAWAFLETLELPGRADPQPVEPVVEPVMDPVEDPETITRNAITAERTRINDITDMCRQFNADDQAAGLIGGGMTLDAARASLMEHLATRDAAIYRAPLTIEADAQDKFRNAAIDALCLRANLAVADPAEGASDLRGYSLREMARESLRQAGQPVGGSVVQMVGRALTTGDLPYVLSNVANKSLADGWEAAGETWREWCATGQVTDFKTNTLVRVSEASDLDEIPEGQPYTHGKRTEAKEEYSIATYGKAFAITRQTLVNDDLNALTEIPRAHGEAAARKVGDLPYAVLTANAAMGDGVALFASGHGNLGTGGAFAQDLVTEAIKLMGLQKDLQGLRRLNIRPEFFLAPKALEGTCEVFFRSEKFSDPDTIATDSSLASTRVNPYAGNYFTRVYEARLDDDSATAFYFAARKGKTVKVFFLDGIEEPFMEMRDGWSIDGVEYKVRIDAGAKAMDWAGLLKNAGTS